MIFRKATLAVAAIFMAATAFGRPATAVAGSADDSLESAVAVFVASNVKLSVENALASLIDMGMDVDTAAVKRLIIEQLALPYDGAAHERANNVIDAAMAAAEVRASQLMLANAAARQGAVELPSGLVIETVQEGTGDTPTITDTVAIRYTGTLPDGRVFDAITLDEEPMVSAVGDLAPGMTEGLMHMRKGGSARLTIPASLAYGDAGVPGVIPPGCTLQFDVQLLDIIK